MADTIFGKIVRGEIPCDKVYEDELVLAFRDIHPQAPTHILIIPKKAIVSMAEVEEGDEAVLGRMMVVASRIARERGVDEDGYRLVVNTGGHGGQTVFHLHMHLLAGRQLGWPPG
jgi:histidine triad (HIT) family protein